tara:strand:+ start:1439 stop:2110 length:672 start_codon:yes stop_codon:yes gene_type:complete
MEFIEKFSEQTFDYSKKIKDSKFLEGNQTVIVPQGVKDISEIIIGNNEIDFTSIENDIKKQYIINKKLQIASDVKKDSNFSKKFTLSLIQNGLQSMNNLSSVLYLNHYYKIHCVIYNQDTNKYYQTTMKNYPKLICVYKDNKWNKLDKEITNDINYSDIQELSQIINIDTDWMIYKSYLQNISKYKLPDLEKIAQENDISLINENGKKKLKKELYNEINLKHF